MPKAGICVPIFGKGAIATVGFEPIGIGLGGLALERFSARLYVHCARMGVGLVWLSVFLKSSSRSILIEVGLLLAICRSWATGSKSILIVGATST